MITGKMLPGRQASSWRSRLDWTFGNRLRTTRSHLHFGLLLFAGTLLRGHLPLLLLHLLRCHRLLHLAWLHLLRSHLGLYLLRLLVTAVLIECRRRIRAHRRSSGSWLLLFV